jgi:ABC-2 type transport system ATP-binding protein
MSTEMIRTEDLGKQFDDFWAVNGIHLSVSAGEILVLLGPNGAGKTTTIRMLTSILRPTKGRAWVAGHDVVTEADQVRSAVGVLTEHHGLYARMNADEYLKFYSQIYGLSPDHAKNRITELLDQFGLLEARKKRLGEYSKGMRQKLALVRALLHEPPVILLDEPTSAMDPESARIVRDAIHNLKRHDRTLIICTHNLLEAEEIADQVAIIQRGKIILNGTMKELRRSLIGPQEYRIEFSAVLDGYHPILPDGAELLSTGSNWLQYRTAHPETVNSQVMQILAQGVVKPLTLSEVYRSLEDIYLQTVTQNQEGYAHSN